MLPVFKRKQIILRCVQNPPDNLNGWLAACARNWEDQNLEKQLTGVATGARGGRHLIAAGTNASPASSDSLTVHSASPRNLTAALTSSVDYDGFIKEFMGTLPTLSQELFSVWPDNKSAMIRIAAESLQGEALGVFLTLPVADQLALAFTFMVAAPGDPSQRAILADAWFHRLQVLRGSSAPSSMPVAGTHAAQAVPCKVQFILAGLPTCMCAVVVASVQLILPKLHPSIQWTFCPVITLSEETDDEMPVAEAFGRTGAALREEVTSFKSLATHMSSLWTTWSTENVKFVLISCLSHDAGIANTKALEIQHLHSRSNRWLWGMVSASEALRTRAGDSNVADVLIAPATPTGVLHQELSTLWGPEALGIERFEPDRLAGCSRPSFFCTPRGVCGAYLRERFQKHRTYRQLDGTCDRVSR